MAEGDNITPIGHWRVEQILYRPDKIDTMPRFQHIPVLAINPSMGWNDDPNHPDYNQLIGLPAPFSHEKLWRDDDCYNIIWVLSYNRHPVIAGLGSAIFVHIAHENYAPTAGCIAMAQHNILELCNTIKFHENIVLHLA